MFINKTLKKHDHLSLQNKNIPKMPPLCHKAKTLHRNSACKAKDAPAGQTDRSEGCRPRNAESLDGRGVGCLQSIWLCPFLAGFFGWGKGRRAFLEGILAAFLGKRGNVLGCVSQGKEGTYLDAFVESQQFLKAWKVVMKLWFGLN